MYKNPSTSKTYIEADWECRRLRYYKTEYEGWGLEPTSLNEDLEIGKRIHVGLEAFFLHPGVSPDDRLEVALDVIQANPFSDPWQAWMEASLIAWALRVWPELDKLYEIVLVEPRLSFMHNGVKYKVGPDLVLRSRIDKSYWVYDFKSYTYWDNKRWGRAIQLQLGVLAVEAELSKPDHPVEVSGSIIQGLYKGQTRKNQLYHPLVYGYRREANPGLTNAAYSWEYKKGFERFDVAAYPGGIRAWILGAPNSIISDCFPQTAPIYVNRPLMMDFLVQRSQRELDIAHATGLLTEPDIIVNSQTKAGIMASEFEQNFGACESDRRTCPMFEVCHMEAVNKDPVGSGLFVLRGARG